MSEWVYYLTKNKKEKEGGEFIINEHRCWLTTLQNKWLMTLFTMTTRVRFTMMMGRQAGSMKQFKGILALFFALFQHCTEYIFTFYNNYFIKQRVIEKVVNWVATVEKGVAWRRLMSSSRLLAVSFHIFHPSRLHSQNTDIVYWHKSFHYSNHCLVSSHRCKNYKL